MWASFIFWPKDSNVFQVPVSLYILPKAVTVYFFLCEKYSDVMMKYKFARLHQFSDHHDTQCDWNDDRGD